VKRIHRFVTEAVLLGAVQILTRAVSVAYNAYLSQKIGAEAMGLFTLVMSVYGFGVTLAASGVHLAAVRLTAEAMARGTPPLRAVVRGCLAYSLLFGGAAGVLLLAFSAPIGIHVLHDARTIPSLRALALSLPALSLSAALSGYANGRRRVYRGAAAAVAGQAVRVLGGAALLTLFVPAGIEYACLAAALGATAAEVVSLAVTALLCLRDGVSLSRAPRPAFGLVCRAALPVAVGSYARTGLLTLEHLAIPWGLRQNGASASAALAAYGVVHGMVFPLLLFPAAVVGAVSSLLIPEAADYHARGDMPSIRRMTGRVLRVSLVFSVGVAAAFLTFPDAIGDGLYPGAGTAAYILRLAPLIPVMYLDSSVDAILKGLGEQVYSMKVNILDAATCLALVLLLVPRFGVAGYVAVQYVCEILNAALSLGRLLAVTGVRPRLSWLAAPLAAAFSAFGAARLTAPRLISLLPGNGPAAAALLAAAGLYAALVYYFNYFINFRRKGLTEGAKNGIVLDG